MAECSTSQLTVDWFGDFKVSFDVSDWTNDQDLLSAEGVDSLVSSSRPQSNLHKRSDIVHAIIYNRSLEHLRCILGSGWDINEVLQIPDHGLHNQDAWHDQEEWQAMTFDDLDHRYTARTALGEAAIQGWTEGVKVLLAAGAECNTSILTLALENYYIPPDIIELLLKHGAGPNDHDGDLDNIPLLCAIRDRQECVSAIVKLLLEHGADPNVRGEREENGLDCPISIAQRAGYGEFVSLFKVLVQFGADVNYNISGALPLLHGITIGYSERLCHRRFYQEELDLFFQHGGDINMADGQQRTALEFAVRENAHSNSIRWLIRHGADISPVKFTLLKKHFTLHQSGGRQGNLRVCYQPHQSDTALVLLQAGMRVSHGALTQLSNMETALSAWLQNGTQGEEEISRRIQDMWEQLVEVEEREHQGVKKYLRKSSLPDYWPHQMEALQEVSDEALKSYKMDDLEQVSQESPEIYQVGDFEGFNGESPHTIYPEEYHIEDTKDCWQSVLEQIHPVLEFLSQPPSLVWHCRRCVRENLVSLQPSVVKTLPVPAILKHYILCHEI